MPTQIALAEDGDFPRLFEIAATAFGRNEPLFDILFPDHWTPAGRQIGAQRFLQSNKNDQKITFIKAVDDETGTIMGFAKWIIFVHHVEKPADPSAPAEPNYWGSAEEKAFADDVTAQFLKSRMDELAKCQGSMVSLDILAVDPAHQRKKVGDSLAKWGTARADSLGFTAVVESSKPGSGLYKKHGFVIEHTVPLVAPPPYEGRPCGELIWMVRPKKSSANDRA